MCNGGDEQYRQGGSRTCLRGSEVSETLSRVYKIDISLNTYVYVRQNIHVLLEC